MEYKFLPHTADVKFQAFGKTIEKAFENAAYALKEAIADNTKIKPKIKIKIKIKGKDKESLLYNFLEEFLFLLDSEDFILSKLKRTKIDEKNNTLSAELIGDKASGYKFTNDVKAVTYNQMFVEKDDSKNQWIVQVVLDV